MKTISAVMKIFFSILIFLTFAMSAQSADINTKSEKMRLAVMDLNAKGKVSKVTANAISDFLRSDIVDTARFVVVERSQMDAIFKEQGLQTTGCTDNTCAVEIGKLISANKMIMGEVNQINDYLVITIRVIDVSKGVAEFSTSEKTDNLDEIDKTVKILVDKLTLRMTGKKAVEYYERPAGYFLRGIAPGWAQLYAGNSAKGWSFAGAALASAGYMGWAITDYMNKKKKYDDLELGAPDSEWESRYNAKKDAAFQANLSTCIFIGIYALNWIDVVFFNHYSPDSTASLENNYGCYLSVNTSSLFYDSKEKNLELSFNIKF